MSYSVICYFVEVYVVACSPLGLMEGQDSGGILCAVGHIGSKSHNGDHKYRIVLLLLFVL